MKIVRNLNKSIKWIENYSNPDAGIAITHQNKVSYPEVSGYYIPTLLNWGERERALHFAKWLMSCQRPDGAWGGPSADGDPYAFDTGQILKGLVDVAGIQPSVEIESAIRRACEWIVSHIDSTGKISPPDITGWADKVPIGIMLYAYEPILRASEMFNEPAWTEKVNRSIKWFLEKKDLTDFTHLSHFHAYVLEALCDLGHFDRAAEGMKIVTKLQRWNGAVPGFKNVRWVCSTGLFQYAIIWYKLGDQKRGDLAFEYASSLQNPSGGWFGSYGFFQKYFPKDEISWAVKYFLDALHLKLKTSFEAYAPHFNEHIARDDGRYLFVKDQILNSNPLNALDLGCGKGRYLRNLIQDCPTVTLTGVDLSKKVIKSIPSAIKTLEGSLLRLQFSDSHFDLVYTVEALEHSVYVEGALKEIFRVTKAGGTIVIIDKNSKKLGSLKLSPWEQWFDSEDLKNKLEKLGASVQVFENIPYENQSDGLFTAWVAKKNG